MSKVTHEMSANGTTVCGRTIEINGTGPQCKQCATRVIKNAQRVAAMVPSGNGLVEGAGVEIPPALTDEVISAHDMDAADVAEYNIQRSADIESAVMTAQRAITDNGRVFLAETHNFGGRAVFDALVASGWAELINDGDMSRYVRTVKAERRPMDNPGDMWTQEKRAAWNALSEPESAPDQPTPPAIPGYYWARHNGHTSVESGPTVRTTDTYQLIKDGTTCQVAATISHVSGFRWRPSGCVWINTGLSSGWDGVPLTDAFARVQTYMAEVAHVRATDPTNHYARVSAGDVARSGLPFISAHEVRLIADTPSKAPVVAVGTLNKPTRTNMGRRVRKALSRKHKPSKARRG